LKSDEKRNNRINMLHQRALNRKFNDDEMFRYDLVVASAMTMGVSKQTAESYADVVVTRLKKAGHLK